MSFANSSNKQTSFGPRPVKRKKQDFHRHKIKAGQETAQANDVASLKERTTVALDHLGEQKFTEEPGGYSFQNWLKSFNVLLDDFEEQAGPQNLPKSYFSTRLAVTSSLVESNNSSSDLDSEISKLKEEVRELDNALVLLQARDKVGREVKDRREKVRVLETEREHWAELLEEAKSALAEKYRQMENSSKLLKRIMSGLSKPKDQTALHTLENKVKELETKVDSLDKRIAEQRRNLEFTQLPKASSLPVTDVKEGEAKLDSARSKLEELEGKRREEGQLLEKRKEATAQMKELISKLEIRSQNPEVD